MRGRARTLEFTPLEHDEQVALVSWADGSIWRYPDLKWLYAIPNGGARHPAVAAKLKAEGVRRGVPDLCLPVRRGRYPGAYVEMKRLAGSRITLEQVDWRTHLLAQGYAHIVAAGFVAARDFLLAYLDERLP